MATLGVEGFYTQTLFDLRDEFAVFCRTVLNWVEALCSRVIGECTVWNISGMA